MPPGDADAFADAIVRLAESPEERKRLGTATREYAVEALDRKKILSHLPMR